MHTDRGRGEGVVGWEDERAPVLTAVVGSVLGSCDDVMPFQDVGLGGVGSDVRRGVLSDGFVFARQALVCRTCSHGELRRWRCLEMVLGRDCVAKNENTRRNRRPWDKGSECLKRAIESRIYCDFGDGGAT